MWHTVVERWQSLTKEQRISMVVLVLCGILAIGLSVYRINNSIKAPFMVDKSVIAKDKLLIGETDAEKIAREKRTDTDGDGLSDWDESNVYRTNPNLRDSCGDGFADNIRVLTGKNLGCLNSPNAGGNLDYSQVNSTSSDIFTSPSSASLLNQAQGVLGGASSSQGGLPAGDINAQTNMLQRDPTAIRQALVQSGKIDQAKIDTLTDQQLLELYDAAVEADTQSLNPNNADQTPTDPAVNRKSTSTATP